MSETYQRLSDHVLQALDLAVKQNDLTLSEHLSNALELAMTRGAGGSDFVERREFSKDVEGVLRAYNELRQKKGFKVF